MRRVKTPRTRHSFQDSQPNDANNPLADEMCPYFRYFELFAFVPSEQTSEVRSPTTLPDLLFPCWTLSFSNGFQRENNKREKNRNRCEETKVLLQ